MPPTIQGNLRSKQRSSANSDKAGVDDNTVKVDEDALADLHIVTVVNSKWRLNPRLILQNCVILSGVPLRRWKRGRVLEYTM
jgi:hypothetical protein